MFQAVENNRSLTGFSLNTDLHPSSVLLRIGVNFQMDPIPVRFDGLRQSLFHRKAVYILAGHMTFGGYRRCAAADETDEYV